MNTKARTTILIVDDDPDIIILTEKFLKLGDYDTITSTNMKDIMKLLEMRFRYITMILLNPMMPRLKYYLKIFSLFFSKTYQYF